MNLTLINPPEAGSRRELDDLKAVIKQYHNRLVPASLQERCDKDMTGLLHEYLFNRGIVTDIESLNRIEKQLTPTIMKLKNYYNRQRPNELSEELGIKWDCDYLSSAQTPSYPSGHTIQAYVCAGVLANQYPEHSRGLYTLAELVSQSRIDRGVHFPSDVDYGRILAKEILEELFFVS